MQGVQILVDTVVAQGPITKRRGITLGGVHGVADVYGVAVSDAAVGEPVPVTVIGTELVEAGAAIPLGTKYLVTDAQGRFISGGNADACVAKLRPGQSAAAAGALVEVLLVGSV